MVLDSSLGRGPNKLWVIIIVEEGILGKWWMRKCEMGRGEKRKMDMDMEWN